MLHALLKNLLNTRADSVHSDLDLTSLSQVRTIFRIRVEREGLKNQEVLLVRLLRPKGRLVAVVGGPVDEPRVYRIESRIVRVGRPVRFRSVRHLNSGPDFRANVAAVSFLNHKEGAELLVALARKNSGLPDPIVKMSPSIQRSAT